MNLNAVHIVLTYRCTRTCDHCFHFGKPGNAQVITSSQLKRYLSSIKSVSSVKWIFFEGGEPTLYFPLLIEGLRVAHEMGFNTAVVTNGYWITSVRDMIPWLRQFRDVNLNLLQISIDELHENTRLEPLQADITDAAERAGILCRFIGVRVPEPNDEPIGARRGETIVQGDIVFRGRAAHRLIEPQAKWLWSSFDECPHENLADPFRVHIEPYGNVMVCDGISIGKLGGTDLSAILNSYEPDEHAIVGPLTKGGPAQLAIDYELEHKKGYVDACHLCYSMRRSMLKDFGRELSPGFLYGNRGSGGNKKKGSGRNRRGRRKERQDGEEGQRDVGGRRAMRKNYQRKNGDQGGRVNEKNHEPITDEGHRSGEEK